MATYQLKTNIEDLNLLLDQLKEVLEKIDSFNLQILGCDLIEVSDPPVTQK